MARHDYQHVACRVYVPDYDVPVTVGAQAGAPRCVVCGQPLDWVPAAPAMDFGPSGGAGFKAFTIDEEIRGETQRIEIDSLAKLRRVERESEQRARNGEGRPLVWRDYQQGRSNRDVHTLSTNLADPHGVRETIQPKVQDGTITPRRGAAVTAAHGTI
jgi:hypothetical protein